MNRHAVIFILTGLCFFITASVFANVEIRKFDNKQQEQRYHHLISELRCLVCQNQNLADSNSELAMELRQRIYGMLQQGKSDKDINQFMVERYGEFVLYRPPLDGVTAILWGGPFLALLAGIVVLLLFIRRRRQQSEPSLNAEQHARAQSLLNADNNKEQDS